MLKRAPARLEWALKGDVHHKNDAVAFPNRECIASTRESVGINKESVSSNTESIAVLPSLLEALFDEPCAKLSQLSDVLSLLLHRHDVWPQNQQYVTALRYFLERNNSTTHRSTHFFE
jgi:hypothetical protein